MPATKTGFKWTGSAAITATTSIRAQEVPLSQTEDDLPIGGVSCASFLLWWDGESTFS